MLVSMTGYGRGIAKGKDGALIVELKSVNSKYLEIRCHLPKEYADMESKVSSYLKKRFNRGSVDLSLIDENKQYLKANSTIDFEKAKKFYAQAKKLAKELKLKGEIDINTVLKCKDLYSQGDASPLAGNFEILLKGLKSAADNLEKMRKREGEHLGKDIKKRLEKIAALLNEVDKNQDLLYASIRDKFAKRISDIKGDIQVDPSRLEQEVVIFAARGDITEEITRLKSHFNRMDEYLAVKGPCGRNLDFTIQEMNREINTIGSKSQSTGISGHVVEMKSELEKIREQVQNIE